MGSFFKLKAFVFLIIAFQIYAEPFSYDLHLVQSDESNKNTLICFHGMGGNYQLANYVKTTTSIPANIVGFNFPDHDLNFQRFNPESTTFGTIQELLPALYVLKKIILENNKSSVNLYGFSAGGGAILNSLVVLNSKTYDAELKKIGIEPSDKEKILQAIQKGWIILDAPLKSIRELIAFRGPSKELEVIGKRYKKNQMEPIDNIAKLSNLPLHVLIYFENPDEVLSNKDDLLFIERFKKANLKGVTLAIIGKNGGHLPPHPQLWQRYLEITNSSTN